MDKSKVQYLVNFSKRYLNDELAVDEKDRAVEISQELFYQTLFDDTMDSELNKRVQLFAVMARQLGQGKPMCPQKKKDLRGMVEFVENSMH